MISVADLRPIDLFDGLTDAQLQELVDSGTEVVARPGDVLFVEGTPAESWWVLVDGTVELVRRVGREETVVGAMDRPGRWAGGFRAWDDHAVYLATGRAAAPARLLRVPAGALRERSQAWFPFGAHLVDGLYHTARNIEASTRQREALVALGTLAAGLAHELNNPAAAASRAAQSLSEACTTLQSALAGLAAVPITAEQFMAIEDLRGSVRPPAEPADPLLTADREDELSTWFAAHGVDRDWVLGPPLAAAGVDPDWCEALAGRLPATALGPALEWVAGTVTTNGLLAEVQESTRRISALVAAARTYSQLDRASEQRIDVVEGLESTLAMLGHRIPPGVTVVRDYAAGLPAIDAYAGELNQVWTNLLDNAIDAIDAIGDGGTLRVSARADEGGGVVVEVADSGPGMPPEVQQHAFEPFFTTKDVGRGTGLGLDISRRIVVERHGGDIAIESEPGRTVLRVRLPRRRS